MFYKKIISRLSFTLCVLAFAFPLLIKANNSVKPKDEKEHGPAIIKPQGPPEPPYK